MSRRITQKEFTVNLERYNGEKPERTRQPYQGFDLIDGRHSWQSAVPEGYVAYDVKKLEKGKIIYFNFALAREMGLIPADHRDEMTETLRAKIIDTFSIRIVNEYDIENGHTPPSTQIKPHRHMATRYLQLQHSSRQGKTSGDGRSVWNGMVRHAGKIWDISSRGTGVTCLAPGAVSAKKNLRTGDFEHGYGCGLADVTELYGSAVMSEIFHLNEIETERMLVIIDLGRGCGIGVRAAQNLIRPAHLFLYLKQNKYDSLKRAVDYLIMRQIENGIWNFSPTAPDRYEKMLFELSRAFGRFAADLERNYIFAWMDWDGDNVLANAGIIDYGSIRMFGMRHDQYRYDDVDRFSTNLNEQRAKARLTVQVFTQMVEYLQSKKRVTAKNSNETQKSRKKIHAKTSAEKKPTSDPTDGETKQPLHKLANHPALRAFDRAFDERIREVFLRQVGFTHDQQTQLMSKNRKLVEDLYSTYSCLERTKTVAGARAVPDGVNRPAIFNMRRLLRELPSMIVNRTAPNLAMDAKAGAPIFGKLKIVKNPSRVEKVNSLDHQPGSGNALAATATVTIESIPPKTLLTVMASNFAKKADLKLRGRLPKKISSFLEAYGLVLRAALGEKSARISLDRVLEFQQNAQERNRAGRITGNGSEFIVDTITRARKRGVDIADIQAAIDLFVASQAPTRDRSSDAARQILRPTSLGSAAGRLFQEMVNVAHEFEEDI